MGSLEGARRPCLCPHPAPCADSSPSVVRTGENLALPMVRHLSFFPSQAQGRVQRAPANTTPQPLVRPCVPQARALGHQDDAWAARTVPDCRRGSSWVPPAGLLHEPCSQKNLTTACLPKPNVTFLMIPKGDAARETSDTEGKGAASHKPAVQMPRPRAPTECVKEGIWVPHNPPGQTWGQCRLGRRQRAAWGGQQRVSVLPGPQRARTLCPCTWPSVTKNHEVCSHGQCHHMPALP